MSKLVIVVPAGRRAAGQALLLGDDGKPRLAPFPVLATAAAGPAARHGNADRNWRRPFGHTPPGSYVVAGALPPGDASRSCLLGALALAPAGGDALLALRAGRTRFLVHGGPLDSSGRLRPTFGGLRVSNPNLTRLLRAINDAHAEGDPLSSVEVTETSGPPPAPVSRAALGFGRARSRTTRRDFVGLALITLAAAACGGTVVGGDGDEGGGGAGGGGSPNPGGPDGGAGGDDGGGPDGGYDGGVSDGGSGTTGGGETNPGSGTTGDTSGTSPATGTAEGTGTNPGVGTTGDGITSPGVGTTGDGVTNPGVGTTGNGVTNPGVGTTGDGTTGDGTTGDGTTGDGTTGDGTTGTGDGTTGTGDGTTGTGDGTTGDGFRRRPNRPR